MEHIFDSLASNDDITEESARGCITIFEEIIHDLEAEIRRAKKNDDLADLFEIMESILHEHSEMKDVDFRDMHRFLPENQ